MGKKKQSAGLGKSIIRDRFGKRDRKAGETFLHTADLQDGYDWGRLNLQSVTEQNNLDDFLATAELAGTEFTAEKLNVKFVSQETGSLPHSEELKTIKGLHKQHEKLLRIPRRPPWSVTMSASEVDQNERAAFLDWRRSLASLQEDERIVMTPYEKNLDFWRQLWRVIERSDIVVQIVDARNPLLFYCPDLEAYVKEVDKNKTCLVLINKADFLSKQQREAWADYFTSKGIRVAFWSAVQEAARQELAGKQENVHESLDNHGNIEEKTGRLSEYEKDDDDDDDDDDVVGDDENVLDSDDSGSSEEHLTETKTDNFVGSDDLTEECDHHVQKCDERRINKLEDSAALNSENTEEESSGLNVDDGDVTECTGTEKEMEIVSDCLSQPCARQCSCDKPDKTGLDDKSRDSCEHVCNIYQELMTTVEIRNTSMIYTGPELLELFKSIHQEKKVNEDFTTVGMVGYPNVGKSSTINAILKMKKVPVSATPGRTKHFQTLFVDPTLMLCDCPGLVFPSFVTTKADLVLAGILPIDQMRDYVSPTALLCQKIPRWLLERTYGLCIPRPVEGEDEDRPPTAYELLNTYGAMRGFMTNRGLPDGPRSARYLLKDYVNGKLLFCHPPPDLDALEFNGFSLSGQASESDSSCLNDDNTDHGRAPLLMPSKVDAEFFRKEFSTIHTRSVRGDQNLQAGSSITAYGESSQTYGKTKSWKKHNNRNKKEKLRRVYGYLDK